MECLATKSVDAKRSTVADKLSNLPEEVLNNILCFLSQKQALRTSVLSKSWRRVGSTRSKLEFSRIDDFNGDHEKFHSVLHETLQRYNHQNLRVHQLVLETNHHDPPTIPFKLEFVQELYLRDCDLSRIDFAPDENDNLTVLLKHIRKLSLDRVRISNESLEIVFSRCPLLEYLGISNDSSIKSVNTREALNLKHFVYVGPYNSVSWSNIEIDVPTLETIRLVKCRSFRDHNYFPRLKSLYLENVRLNYESFGFFSSSCMPRLEELELNQCEGFREFNLSSPSIKRLRISGLGNLIKATIDASNLVYFQLKPFALSTLSFTPISSNWKSHLELFIYVHDHASALRWISDLKELLESLSQSQTTLRLSFCLGHQALILDSAYGGLYRNKPFAVEHLRLEVDNYSYSTVLVMFNYLFRVCRPRYIYDAHRLSHGRTLTVILREVLLLRPEREKIDLFWHRDLGEVIIETYCSATNEWRPVHGNSLSESALSYNQKIRFVLKWSD